VAILLVSRRHALLSPSTGLSSAICVSHERTGVWHSRTPRHCAVANEEAGDRWRGLRDVIQSLNPTLSVGRLSKPIHTDVNHAGPAAARYDRDELSYKKPSSTSPARGRSPAGRGPRVSCSHACPHASFNWPNDLLRNTAHPYPSVSRRAPRSCRNGLACVSLATSTIKRRKRIERTFFCRNLRNDSVGRSRKRPLGWPWSDSMDACPVNHALLENRRLLVRPRFYGPPSMTSPIRRCRHESSAGRGPTFRGKSLATQREKRYLRKMDELRRLLNAAILRGSRRQASLLHLSIEDLSHVNLHKRPLKESEQKRSSLPRRVVPNRTLYHCSPYGYIRAVTRHDQISGYSSRIPK